MKTCTFVTGNPNKILEVNAILGNSVHVRSLALDIPEIQGTLEEIARDKCRRATEIVVDIHSTLSFGGFANHITSWQVDGPVIVEDSALEFNAMNKLPGPYV